MSCPECARREFGGVRQRRSEAPDCPRRSASDAQLVLGGDERPEATPLQLVGPSLPGGQRPWAREHRVGKPQSVTVPRSLLLGHVTPELGSDFADPSWRPLVDHVRVDGGSHEDSAGEIRQLTVLRAERNDQNEVRYTLLAVALMASLVGCGGSSEALTQPGQIVYAAFPDIVTQLDVMDADGSNQHPLTEADGFGDPEWSPDGTQVVYAKYDLCDPHPFCSQICVRNADGTAERCLTPRNMTSEAPTWSPDGKEIAFMRSDNAHEKTNIFVIAADASATRRLTATGTDGRPSWSPDGNKIAFSSGRDSAAKYASDIYLMTVDGGEVERLTSLGNAGAPDWSPEGEQIAFAVGDGLESSMWVMNADGTDRRVLLATPDYESDPAWSPDGAQIVFVCRIDSTGSDEICLMNADGTEVRVTTNYNAGLEGTSSPDWAPALPND